MRLHGLRQLVDDKSVASCQNLLYTCLLQMTQKTQQARLRADPNFPWEIGSARRLATSLILTDLMRLNEIDKFVATFDEWQQAGKIDNLLQ